MFNLATECRLAAGETKIRLYRLEAAEGYLAGYRTPDHKPTLAERQRLVQLMDAGWTAADAAEQVQAESRGEQ